jgi:HAD superfamily hydrolase (TIGR01509 family)
MFEYVLPENKKHLASELESKFKRYYVDEGHFTDQTVLFPHVLNTLRYFKEKGFFMSIASSKPERVLSKMIHHFKLNCFDLILGTEESRLQHKPHPEIINVTLDRLNVSREDAVIVGDSGVDVKTGKNANIDTIAVTYGFGNSEKLRELNPTCIIDDFKALIDIIKYRV